MRVVAMLGSTFSHPSLTQGKPSVHPRLISPIRLQHFPSAGLRSISALLALLALRQCFSVVPVYCVSGLVASLGTVFPVFRLQCFQFCYAISGRPASVFQLFRYPRPLRGRSAEARRWRQPRRGDELGALRASEEQPLIYAYTRIGNRPIR